MGLPGPDRAARDPRRARLETYDRYREGSSVYIDQHGSRTEYTGDIFPLPDGTATEIERLVAVVDEYVAKVDPDPSVGDPGRRGARTRSPSASGSDG